MADFTGANAATGKPETERVSGRMDFGFPRRLFRQGVLNTLLVLLVSFATTAAWAGGPKISVRHPCRRRVEDAADLSAADAHRDALPHRESARPANERGERQPRSLRSARAHARGHRSPIHLHTGLLLRDGEDAPGIAGRAVLSCRRSRWRRRRRSRRSLASQPGRRASCLRRSAHRRSGCHWNAHSWRAGYDVAAGVRDEAGS